MASTATTASTAAPNTVESEASLARLYLLRATDLLLVVGLGATKLPPLLNHAQLARGVIPSLFSHSPCVPKVCAVPNNRIGG